MAKKYHYYVLVFSESGPVYVTSIEREHKVAHWDKDKKPLEFSSMTGEDLVLGLTANFHSVVLVKSDREIESQPYRYSHYDCKFVEKENEDA